MMKHYTILCVYYVYSERMTELIHDDDDDVMYVGNCLFCIFVSIVKISFLFSTMPVYEEDIFQFVYVCIICYNIN
jgi:hypothetical protein